MSDRVESEVTVDDGREGSGIPTCRVVEPYDMPVLRDLRILSGFSVLGILLFFASEHERCKECGSNM